jgi:hypothetical protein
LLDGLAEVCLPFVVLKLLVRGRKKRTERWGRGGKLSSKGRSFLLVQGHLGV